MNFSIKKKLGSIENRFEINLLRKKEELSKYVVTSEISNTVGDNSN